jgi:flagellar biogenesis protein FliO
MAVAFAASAQSQKQEPLPPSQPTTQEALAERLDLSGEGVNPQTQTIDKHPSAWRAFFSLVFVLGLAGGGVWALRKWGIKRLPGSGGNRMKVEETLALGERRHVSILKVDEESFLVAVYPQGIKLLARLDGSAEPGFERELEQQLNAEVPTPIPVRDMEARLRGELE